MLRLHDGETVRPIAGSDAPEEFKLDPPEAALSVNHDVNVIISCESR